jgi:hypothetical protein
LMLSSRFVACIGPAANIGCDARQSLRLEWPDLSDRACDWPSENYTNPQKTMQTHITPCLLRSPDASFSLR